jgi:hypothetical protein
LICVNKFVSEFFDFTQYQVVFFVHTCFLPTGKHNDKVKFSKSFLGDTFTLHIT